MIWYSGLFVQSHATCVLAKIMGLILEHSELEESYVSPMIGDDHCFLGSGLPTLLYFHIINAPALVILFS